MQLSGIKSLIENSSFIKSKCIISSNSTSRIHQIRKINNNENNINNNYEIENLKNKKQSFCEEQILNEDNDSFIGMNKEVYERLKNEKIDFIQTLLRLKKKMADEKKHKTPEKQKLYLNNQLNISLTESKNNDKKSNFQRFPTFNQSNNLIKKKENPIKVKNSFKNSFVSEQRKLLKNYNKSDILIPKTKITLTNSFINNNIISNSNKKNSSSKKNKSKKDVQFKSLILSKIINQILKKRKKEVKIENHCSKLTNLSNNSTCFSNASINPMIEIPSATINLFD